MPQITALARGEIHSFSKERRESLRLLAGLGVEGDAHCGRTVQHRSRVAIDPERPNLRQVHLIQSELFDELSVRGFDIEAGQLGENVQTRGIDLLALPTDTRLMIGEGAVLEIKGLRNPCAQIEGFRTGLLRAVTDRDAAGRLIRRAGVMAIVLESGEIREGDAVSVEYPPPPHRPLECV